MQPKHVMCFISWYLQGIYSCCFCRNQKPQISVNSMFTVIQHNPSKLLPLFTCLLVLPPQTTSSLCASMHHVHYGENSWTADKRKLETESVDMGSDWFLSISLSKLSDNLGNSQTLVHWSSTLSCHDPKIRMYETGNWPLIQFTSQSFFPIQPSSSMLPYFPPTYWIFTTTLEGSRLSRSGHSSCRARQQEGS